MFSNSVKIATEATNLDTITKLKFISTILPLQKINVQNLKIENNNIFTPFKRMFYGESRNTTLNFITSTIEKSFNILEIYVNSEKKSETLFCNNLIADLIKSINGLYNIQKTYEDDNIFVCSVSAIIESIKAKLMEFKDQNPSIFSSSENFEIHLKHNENIEEEKNS